MLSWTVEMLSAAVTDFGAPKTITDKLQRVLNAAARVVSDTRKFDCGLTSLMHDELHWLDVPERISYNLQAGRHDIPQFSRSGTSVPRRPSHYILWGSFSALTASSAFCIVPRCRLNTYGRRDSGVFDRWSAGTRCLMSSKNRRVVLTVLNSFY